MSAGPHDPFADLVGESPPIAALRERLRRFLNRLAAGLRVPPLLLLGETGTGKGLVASILHRAGPHATGPFVSVNCAAIPSALLEAEFFGFERGAFTDARQAKPGLLESAEGGTLFLDEVGLLPEALQGKLLTVLDDRQVRRLGSTRGRVVDVWLVAATSVDLEDAVRERRFRDDLYHRLATLSLTLPPLRARGTDVLHLARAFLARACADYRLPPRTLTAPAQQALLAYPWPGNVRELANTMERAALMGESSVIGMDELALPVGSGPLDAAIRVDGPALAVDRAEARRSDDGASAQPWSSVRDAMGDFERRQLLGALEAAEWNVSRAAESLGIPRTTLRYRMTRHALFPPDGRELRPVPPLEPREPTPAEQPSTDTTAVPVGGTATRWQAHVTFLRVCACSTGHGPGWSTEHDLDRFADQAEAFGGVIVARRAAGVDAAFGLEPAEDAPSRAANAALAIQKLAERRLARDGPWHLVLALDTGLCPVETVDGTPRLQPETWGTIDSGLAGLVERAQPGIIVVSSSTATLIQRRFTMEPYVEAADGRPP